MFSTKSLLSWVSLFLAHWFLGCFEHALSSWCNGAGGRSPVAVRRRLVRACLPWPGRGSGRTGLGNCLWLIRHGSQAPESGLSSCGAWAPAAPWRVKSAGAGCSPRSLHWQMDSFHTEYQGCPVCEFACCLFSLFCVESCTHQKFVIILTPSTLQCDC